jgi:hypothetical protein
MTVFEMRMFAVLGFLALGALAIVVSLAIVNLQRLARRPNNRTTLRPAAPSLHGDTHDATRLVDRRPAA